MFRRLLGIVLCGISLSGCAVHEVRKDHDLIRTTLLDLYTNQIMDNLVRMANGLPIIQLDYTNAAATVTITNTLGGSDNQATTATNMFAIPAASLSATRSIVTTLMGNASNMNSNQIAITAQPVTTSNDVYDAYISYLDAEKNPGSLMVTCDPPNPGQAHMCKKFNGQYYWVPIEYRKLFFQLALLTTSQRGKALQEPDKFYAVTLKDPAKPMDNPTFPGMGYVLTFNIDKQKIPIDSGYLILDNDKAGTEFPIQTVPSATNAGSIAPTVAAQLLVTVRHDDIDIDVRLGSADEKEPEGEKNLLYVSIEFKKDDPTAINKLSTSRMSKFCELRRN